MAPCRGVPRSSRGPGRGRRGRKGPRAPPSPRRPPLQPAPRGRWDTSFAAETTTDKVKNEIGPLKRAAYQGKPAQHARLVEYMFAGAQHDGALEGVPQPLLADEALFFIGDICRVEVRRQVFMDAILAGRLELIGPAYKI